MARKQDDPRDELWKQWPSPASVIFKLVESERALSAFGLDSFFSPPGSSRDRLSATFSRVAVSGYGRDQCYVSALKDSEGEWSASYTLKLAP